ncbi:MAG: hypothetical protein EAX86_12640 [Candidatus Heimdallarchaeota archaeon]|nr:hypothetical protein [Candidatus Heimdallarchaeota archaeon]
MSWVPGNHTLYLEVKDTSGNMITDEVLITLVIVENIETQTAIGTAGFNLLLVGIAVFVVINLEN